MFFLETHLYRTRHWPHDGQGRALPFRGWTSWLWLFLLGVGLPATAMGVPLEGAAAELRVVVPRTGLQAAGYPRVFVRLFEEGRPKVGTVGVLALYRAQAEQDQWADLNLAELERPQSWYTAVLDTGASLHLVTQPTAQRFGIATIPGVSVISEGGFNSMEAAVSYPYSLALAGTRGRLGEFPVDPFVPVLASAQFGVDARARLPAEVLQQGGMNLIGMPAIRGHLFEIDPSNLRPAKLPAGSLTSVEAVRAAYTNVAAPAVNIRPTGTMPTNGIFRLPLRYVDLNRVRRTLAGYRSAGLQESPVLMGVRAQANGRWFVGNWMLDTGSSVSFISRRQALALGWTPQAAESLSATNLVIQDVTGTRQWRMAMRLDKLEFRNPLGQVLEFGDATVLIQDVNSTQPDGSQFMLDGLVGCNLLLPALKPSEGGGSWEWVPSPFKRVFLDGYRAELGLEPPVWPASSTQGEKRSP